MLSLGAGMSAAPASAQQSSQVPACSDQVPTLVWQVRKDRKKRSVNLRYNKERGAGVPGAPLRPVQVQIERSAGTRSFEWTQLNREHYFYRRRGSEAARLTARYVENRSRYERLSTQEGNLGLPALPMRADHHHPPRSARSSGHPRADHPAADRSARWQRRPVQGRLLRTHPHAHRPLS